MPNLFDGEENQSSLLNLYKRANDQLKAVIPQTSKEALNMATPYTQDNVRALTQEGAAAVTNYVQGDYSAAALHGLQATVMGGGAHTGMFVGPKAILSDVEKAAYDKALQMKEAGLPSSKIEQVTGWHKLVNGDLAMHVPDEFTKLKGASFGDFLRDKPQNYGSALKAKSLEYYPELKDLPIKWDLGDQAGFQTTSGLYQPVAPKFVALNPSMLKTGRDTASILLHEGQHGVQQIEGWPGSKPQVGMDWGTYQAQPGEVQARAAQILYEKPALFRTRLPSQAYDHTHGEMLFDPNFDYWNPNNWK